MSHKKKGTPYLGKVHSSKILIAIFVITALSSLWWSKNLPTLFNKFQGGTPAFTDVSGSSLLDTKASYGGVSWVDYNNDSKLDLFFPSDRVTLLYRNNGDGTFEDVTKSSGLWGIDSIMSGVFGDYDNNGCIDLYLSRSGVIYGFESLDSIGKSDLLYKNNCDGTFTNVSDAADIKDGNNSQGASWVDFNNDGYLDIYVVNKGRFQNNNWTIEPNLLYKNNTDGTFSELSSNLGISGYAKCSNFDTIMGKPSSDFTQRQTRNPWKFSFQPIWFDYNNDQMQDLFIASDSGISPLYKNLGNGQFSDSTEEAGLCRLGTGMGVATGDYNNDSFQDIYVTNIDSNFLWKNNGRGQFTEVSKETSTENTSRLGWGTGFLDYDNDGLLDLHAVNGIFLQRDIRYRYTKRQDQLYKNLDGKNFEEVSEKEGLFGNDAKLSSAYGDFNNDGFVDIVVISDGPGVTGVKLPSRLYQNRPNGNNWLTVQLQGTRSNRDGVGAKITLKSGPGTQYREVTAGSSFLSQNSLWQTFGLGKNTSVDELIVSWPSGTTQYLKDIVPNQKILITETK